MVDSTPHLEHPRANPQPCYLWTPLATSSRPSSSPMMALAGCRRHWKPSVSSHDRCSVLSVSIPEATIAAAVYSPHCAATERARDERVAVAGSEWCGCRSTSGRGCRSHHGRASLRPGAGIARGALPRRGLGGGGPAGPDASTDDPGAAFKRLVHGRSPGHKPRSRGEASVSQHAVYRLRDRSLAMPLSAAALLFDIAGRAGGGFRSPTTLQLTGSEPSQACNLARLRQQRWTRDATVIICVQRADWGPLRDFRRDQSPGRT